MKKIYLVDVSSMFFRAFYAVRPLNAADGTPVNAVYGFISMIAKLLKEKNPDYMVFCYDRKEPSFRKDLDQNYKANRSEMPEELQVQMPYIRQVAGLFGIADIELPGYEADDLIGTIAKMANQESYEAVIVSGDKDFCQLVNSHTVVYDTMKEIVTTPELIQEKYGVTPSQFIDYLAITGDSSDNIKGVAGVGPKGAQKLIEEFGSLDKIYSDLNQIKSEGTRKKLEDSKENVFLARKLVTIAVDAPIEKKMEDFKRKKIQAEELRQFFRKLNFKTFEKSILDENKLEVSNQVRTEPIPEATVENKSVKLELKVWDKDHFLAQKRKPHFWYMHKSEVYVILEQSLYHIPAEEYYDEALFSNLIWNGFDIKSIWSHLKLPLSITEAAEVKLDLMVAAYALKTSAIDLEKLSRKYLSKDIDLKKIEILELADVILSLSHIIEKEIEEIHVATIYQKLDRPIIKILYKMEQAGIKLDISKLNSFSKQLENEIKDLEIKIHQQAGESFNIASPKQLGVILFEKLNLEVTKKTKTGYSTDNEVLEKIKHPIAELIIQYRELAKLKSTYVDSLPQLSDIKDRVHTKFNQALTTTGRFSSTDPNLQNIPIKTEKGKIVRQCFVAEKDNKLLSLDYSQIELRVLAHISGDKGLTQAFNDDLDIHQATAAEVFAVPLNQVSKEQRRIAKAVNFGIAYGQGAFGLADTLGISRTESKDIIEKYFKKFSGIKDYIDFTIENAHKNKYVETLFGRRRYIDELSSSNVMLRKFGERAAINAPIQGTASDLVKMAMIDIHKSIPLSMLLQIHDELIFEGTEEQILKFLPQIKYKMENVAYLKVPLKVNYSIGLNWDESH